jgi:hypothetical protein
VLPMVSEVLDELLALAESQGCTLPKDFKQRTIEDMSRSTVECVMYQDYVARRPMEVETYLGSPMKLAQMTGIRLPRVETLYAILHHLNLANQQRPKMDAMLPPPSSPNAVSSPLPRTSSSTQMRSMSNGMPTPNGMPPRQQRPRGASNMGLPPPGMRRGPPSMSGGPQNGYGRPPMNGGPGPNGVPGSRTQSRRGSMDGADLDEFSHLMIYDDIPEAGETDIGAPQAAIALRERELALRQRELQLREQEMRMRRGPPSGQGPMRRGPPGPPGPPSRHGAMYDDDDDGEDYFDPAMAPPVPMIDPDNFDMMSVTSRKNRKAPSQQQLRKNPEFDGGPPSRGGRFRPSFSKNRSSQIVAQVPGLHDDIMSDPLMSCSSNRYGAVDRSAMHHGDSRTNSLTSARLDEFQHAQGAANGMMNGAYPRRTSQSPGNPYSPSIRGGAVAGRPSPPNGYPGPPMNGGRPSPPNGVRQPVPRYPPGLGNAVAPQQVEQHAGVSALQPPKGKIVRSLTGSASVSAGSGDSVHLDSSEPSAHSSQSSLGPRPPIGVR